MNIGIDIRVIGTGRALDNYTRGIVTEILNLDKNNEYTLITDDPRKAQIFQGKFQVRKFLPKKLWRDHFLFLNAIKDLDLIFHPDNTEHLRCLKRSVVTLHDVLPWKFPNLVLSSKKVLNWRQKLYFFIQEKALRRASLILTVSQNSRKDIEEYLKIPKEKIVVTYEGVGPEFKPLPEKDLEEFRQKENLKDPYLFYAGGFDTRKNVSLLLKAVIAIKDKFPNLKLVLAGSPNPGELIGGNEYSQLFKLVQTNNLADVVKFVGYVPPEKLPFYYNGSECFVYPSIYEGFGLPVLEALKCGLPVVSSDSSSLPEVVGNAGLLFKNNDLDNLIKQLELVLVNKELRLNLRNKGLEQARTFTWQSSAKETVAAFQKLR